MHFDFRDEDRRLRRHRSGGGGHPSEPPGREAQYVARATTGTKGGQHDGAAYPRGHAAEPRALPTTATALEAARTMRDVIVMEGGRVCGILVATLCSRDLTVLSPSDSVESAVALMREKAVRRLPVVEHGRPVGIVSLGDLARERDPQSALGAISEAPPNR